MARTTPQQWRDVMERRGISSIRQLSKIAGVSHPAVTRLVHGGSNPADETVARVADALSLSLEDVYSLAGLPVSEASVYEPPAEANRLTERQRKAINELIRAIVAGNTGPT